MQIYTLKQAAAELDLKSRQAVIFACRAAGIVPARIECSGVFPSPTGYYHVLTQAQVDLLRQRPKSGRPRKSTIIPLDSDV